MKGYALIQGGESEERIDLILSLTSIASEQKVEAIKAHYVQGVRLKDAAILAGADLGNLKKTLADLNKVAAVIERVKEIDWPDYQSRRILADK